MNACELLDQSIWCRKVAEPLTNVTEATVGAFNVPVLYQMDLITGDPNVAFFGGLALFWTNMACGCSTCLCSVGDRICV